MQLLYASLLVAFLASCLLSLLLWHAPGRGLFAFSQPELNSFLLQREARGFCLNPQCDKVQTFYCGKEFTDGHLSSVFPFDKIRVYILNNDNDNWIRRSGDPDAKYDNLWRGTFLAWGFSSGTFPLSESHAEGCIFQKIVSQLCCKFRR